LGSRVVGFHAGHFHRGFGYPLLTRRPTFTEFEAPDFRDAGFVRVVSGAEAVFDFVPPRAAVTASVWPVAAASTMFSEKTFLQ
jgi:hypothetical protein